MKRKTLPGLLLLMFFLQPLWGQENIPSNIAGRTNFLIGGYGFMNFESEEGTPSNFESGFNPIFLWKLNDKVFFEGEVEFELEDGSTAVGLEYAQMFYVLNDYVTIGGGKFMSPINNFMERLHPTWINKLPNMPLGLSGHGGVPLMASTQIGMQARGGIDAGSGVITYAVYVSNGPTLNVEATPDTLAALGKVAQEGEEEGHGHGVAENGTLNYNNTSDNNDNKAVGARISFLPFPQVEIGFGIESATVGAKDSPYSNVKALTNAVDFSLTRELGFISGRIDIRGQYVWLDIDNPEVHPLEFENKSNAGYGQIAYQPTGVENEFLRNLELVARYDRLDLPENAPLNVDQKRIAIGLNYWVTPSTVFKAAYERTKLIHEEEETENMFIGQFSIGF
jgi:hypothetical protein